MTRIRQRRPESAGASVRTPPSRPVTHTRMHAHRHARTYTRTHARTHTHTHTHTHTPCCTASRARAGGRRRLDRHGDSESDEGSHTPVWAWARGGGSQWLGAPVTAGSMPTRSPPDVLTQIGGGQAGGGPVGRSPAGRRGRRARDSPAHVRVGGRRGAGWLHARAHTHTKPHKDTLAQRHTKAQAP
jgi:hypothetical protein